MLGKVIGAVAGERIARHLNGVNGTGGALLGAGVATILRRLGPVGLIAAAAGGYVLKRHFDKRENSARTHPAKA